jgi:SOS-response transcriptional repressor LexA
MSGLTRRQKDVLNFITTYSEAHGISPSFADIAMGIKCKSKARVYDFLRILRERGYIDYAPKRARSITVLFPHGKPDWENIARSLYLQNIELRVKLYELGLQPDVPALELP